MRYRYACSLVVTTNVFLNISGSLICGSPAAGEAEEEAEAEPCLHLLLAGKHAGGLGPGSKAHT